jgi:hypothetical protein
MAVFFCVAVYIIRLILALGFNALLALIITIIYMNLAV